MKYSTSHLAFIVSVLILSISTINDQKWNDVQSSVTISWDVSGYYLYLPAFLIYQDATSLAFFEDIHKKYQPSPSIDQYYLSDNGNYVFKYSAGMAVLYLPSFLAGHLWALGSDYPADGFSLPYQMSLHLGSLLVAFIGLWLMLKNLQVYFSEKITAWIVIIIALGTNYFNYASYDAVMPHNYLFTLCALLIYLTIHFYKRPTYRNAILIGLVGGLAALARPTEVLMMLIPIFWGISKREDIPNRIQLWQQHSSKLLASILVFGSIGMIQIIYWQYAAGRPLEYSYQDQGFSWLHPHFMDVFFSYRKGWLVYTPLMVLAFPGFYFLFQKYRTIFWLCFIHFFINTWVVSAWDIWWYGGGFGQRAFIQTFPILVFPMAAFMEYLLQRKWQQLCLGFLVAIGIALNFFQLWQAHQSILNTSYMTEAFYWRIFGKTSLMPEDQFLMDTTHDYNGPRRAVKEIFTNDFESSEYDSILYTKPPSGYQAAFVTPEKQFANAGNFPIQASQINDKSWLRIQAQFFCQQKQWTVWRMPRLMVKFKNKDTIIHETMIRPHRVMKAGVWKSIKMDTPISNQQINHVEIFLWSAGSTKDLVMDDLSVELYQQP